MTIVWGLEQGVCVCVYSMCVSVWGRRGEGGGRYTRWITKTGAHIVDFNFKGISNVILEHMMKPL